MQKLAAQDGVYKNINWDGTAATDFWGPATSSQFRVPDDTRSEIQAIFAAAQQMWSLPFPMIVMPWDSWRYLWIQVRCNDCQEGPKSTDPDNICGDAVPNDGRCPNGQQPPPDSDNKLQAYSDNEAATGTGYTRITFCNNFFKLNDLAVAVENGAKNARKTDLSIYDNTARCFLHEVTHLDYFMGTGPSDPNDPGNKIPHIWDLQINIKENIETVDAVVYGPKYARILRNWIDPDPANSGYYTQRNADTYAWFAMAEHVESKIGQYPVMPRVGMRKPKKAPVNAQDGQEPYDAPADLSATSLDQDLIGGDEDGYQPFSYPGCSDRHS